MQELPAGAVAFLASLQVVFVPILLSLSGNGLFSARLAVAAAMCVGGVGLLEAGGLGDTAAASAFAMPIVPTMLALLQPVGFGTSAPPRAMTPPSPLASRASPHTRWLTAARGRMRGVAASGYLRIEALMKRFPSHGLALSSLQLISNAAIAIL